MWDRERHQSRICEIYIRATSFIWFPFETREMYEVNCVTNAFLISSDFSCALRSNVTFP